MPKVILFSTTTCSWCRRAKKYFKERRVPFREVNVERDASAARMIQKQTGQTGVPVIKIGSNSYVGFDQPAIEREMARRS